VFDSAILAHIVVGNLLPIPILTICTAIAFTGYARLGANVAYAISFAISLAYIVWFTMGFEIRPEDGQPKLAYQLVAASFYAVTLAIVYHVSYALSLRHASEGNSLEN
jgi:hypothetical protein